jgi:hypothetical protein
MSLCLDILCQHTKFYEKLIFPYALCTETKKTHKQHFLTPKFEVLLEVKNAPFDRLLNQLGRQNPFNIVTNSWFLHIIESFHGTCYTRHMLHKTQRISVFRKTWCAHIQYRDISSFFIQKSLTHSKCLFR